jgi:hypothetical protein
MAKANINYDLDNPDDLMEFKKACKSNDMACALFQIIYNTKKGIEYEIEGKEMDKYEVLDLVFDKIEKIMSDNNINIDEIIN